MGTLPPPAGSSPSPLSQTSLDQSVSQSSKEVWTKVVNDAPVSVSQFQPDFAVVDGVARIEIPEEIVADATPLWKNVVAGHFMGDVPHVGTIHATVNRIWTISEKTSKIDVQVINRTTVLFRIANPRIRERVLKRKYWHIADIPLVVGEWNPEAAQTPPDLSAMPMWVDLGGVPGYVFSHEGLELLSSTVGKFVKLHPNTERCIRMDVARILVEVNLQSELTKEIRFPNDKGEEIVVSVNYPWLPPQCQLCSNWGHKEKDCSVAEKVKFLSKTQPTNNQKPEASKQGTSSSVQDLAKSLLHDLGNIPSLQLSIAREEQAGKTTEAPTVAKTAPQWTLVTKNRNSFSPKKSVVSEETLLTTGATSGFRVLEIEREEEAAHPQENNTINHIAQTTDEVTITVEEGDDKEEGEIENSAEVVEEEEKQTSDSIPTDQSSGKAVKANQNRNRSRSRGPPRPITQRKDNGGKGTKKTSSGKL